MKKNIDEETTAPKPKLSISCDEVTLFVFMECYFKGDLSGLGQGTEEELQVAWGLVSEDYAVLVGGEKRDYTLRLLKDIAIRESRLAMLQLANKAGKDTASEILRATGYSVDMLEVQTMQDKAKLEELRHDLEALRGEKQSETSKKDYLRWISLVSQHRGYRIDPKTTTVEEFIIDSNLMSDELKAKQNGRHNR